MKKQKIQILDENMNVESTFYVEIPITRREKEIKDWEKEIKDFLYSIPFLKSFAIKILDWRGRNATI